MAPGHALNHHFAALLVSTSHFCWFHRNALNVACFFVCLILFHAHACFRHIPVFPWFPRHFLLASIQRLKLWRSPTTERCYRTNFQLTYCDAARRETKIKIKTKKTSDEYTRWLLGISRNWIVRADVAMFLVLSCVKWTESALKAVLYLSRTKLRWKSLGWYLPRCVTESSGHRRWGKVHSGRSERLGKLLR